MNILSEVTGYVTQLVIYTVLITILFLLFALIFYWLCHKKHWTQITKRGPSWFKILAIFITAFTGIFIGIIIGFQVSLTNVGIKVLDKLGTTILKQGLEQAIKPIGLSDIYQKINILKANQLLEETKKIKLVDTSGLKGVIINGTFDKIRSPFLQKANTLLSEYAPNSQIIPADLVSTTWNDVYSDINIINKNFTLSKLLIGIIWLFLILIVFALVTSIIRFILTKSKNIAKAS